MSAHVALLTDFGLEDNYVGTLKAVILKINPKACVVDICHSIPPQDILAAALILKGSYLYFSKKTIFLIVVDPGVGSKRKAIILKTKDYTFIAPDNGILSLISDENRQRQIFKITNDKYFLKPTSNTFHGRDVFAPVAAYLSKGLKPNTFGPERKELKKLIFPKPQLNKREKQIDGEIIYIDRFGNLMTNIEEGDIGGVSDDVFISIKNKIISGIRRSYYSVLKARPLAIINSMGYLEIAVNQDSASRILKAKKGEKVRLNFFNL